MNRFYKYCCHISSLEKIELLICFDDDMDEHTRKMKRKKWYANTYDKIIALSQNNKNKIFKEVLITLCSNERAFIESFILSKSFRDDIGGAWFILSKSFRDDIGGAWSVKIA